MLSVLQALTRQLEEALERSFPEAASAARANGACLDPQLAPASAQVEEAGGKPVEGVAAAVSAVEA